MTNFSILNQSKLEMEHKPPCHRLTLDTVCDRLLVHNSVVIVFQYLLKLDF